MEFTGKLISVAKDWNTGRWNLTFDMNENSIDQVNDIKDCEKLAIKAVKWRKKRSLDANAYCWLICTKIAEVIKSDKDSVYEEMIQKYGYIYNNDGVPVVVTVKSEVDMKNISGHWKFLKSNGKFSSYLMLSGSSEYDTREMAHFLDMVILEAKELGIETMTPNQIAEMVSAWKGAGYGKD